MKHPALMAAPLLASALFLAPAASAQQPGDSMRRRADTGMAQMTMMRDSTDARLDSLVRAMNSASGNRKVQAMANVINELVAERKMMHQHMGEMMEHRGMRRHSGMGDSGMMRRRSAPRSPAADSTAR
jgi:hypothetical protein